MDSEKVRIGQVVRLNSGGAPMTVVQIGLGPELKVLAKLVAVSRGGLAQEITVPAAAFDHHVGDITPAFPKERCKSCV